MNAIELMLNMGSTSNAKTQPVLFLKFSHASYWWKTYIDITDECLAFT